MAENLQRNLLIPQKEGQKFNWGAFLLGWVWGIFNKSYITLIQLPLSLIPVLGEIINLACSIWFGFKGNGWALQNKDFESLEDFRKYQKKFVLAGIIMLLIRIFAYITIFIIIGAYKASSIKFIDGEIIMVSTIQLVIVSYIILLILLTNKTSIKLILTPIILVLFALTNFISLCDSYLFKMQAAGKSKEALALSKKLLKVPAIAQNSAKNKNIYDTIINIYINQKDIKNVIIYSEQKEMAMHFLTPRSNNDGDNYLSDLYIITKNYDKVKERGMMYRIYFINEDWDGVIREATKRISSSTIGRRIDNKDYNSDYQTYLARAYAYKKLGKIKEAEEDMYVVKQMLPEKNWNKAEKLYNSNTNYYKESYDNLKKFYNLN